MNSDLERQAEYVKQLKDNKFSLSLLGNPKIFAPQDVSQPFALNHRPFDAAGLPVTLFDPILACFQDDTNGGIEPDDDDYKFVVTLAEDMCSLSLHNEGDRQEKFCYCIMEYVNKMIHPYFF